MATIALVCYLCAWWRSGHPQIAILVVSTVLMVLAWPRGIPPRLLIAGFIFIGTVLAIVLIASQLGDAHSRNLRLLSEVLMACALSLAVSLSSCLVFPGIAVKQTVSMLRILAPRSRLVGHLSRAATVLPLPWHLRALLWWSVAQSLEPSHAIEVCVSTLRSMPQQGDPGEVAEVTARLLKTLKSAGASETMQAEARARVIERLSTSVGSSSDERVSDVLGGLLIQAERWDELVAMCARLLPQQSGSHRGALQLALARSLTALERHSEALAAVEEALPLMPPDSLFFVRTLAWQNCIKCQRWEAAEVHARAALEVAGKGPSLVEARLALGFSLTMLGQVLAALPFLEAPTTARYLALLNLERFDDALDCVNILPASMAHRQSLMRATIELARDRDEAAANHVAQVPPSEHEKEWFIGLKGRLAARAGRVVDAEELLCSHDATHESDVGTKLRTRASILEELGRPAEAIRTWDEALALRTPPLLLPTILLRKGLSEEALGDPGRARASYEAAVATGLELPVVQTARQRLQTLH